MAKTQAAQDFNCNRLNSTLRMAFPIGVIERNREHLANIPIYELGKLAVIPRKKNGRTNRPKLMCERTEKLRTD